MVKFTKSISVDNVPSFPSTIMMMMMIMMMLAGSNCSFSGFHVSWCWYNDIVDISPFFVYNCYLFAFPLALKSMSAHHTCRRSTEFNILSTPTQQPSPTYIHKEHGFPQYPAWLKQHGTLPTHYLLYQQSSSSRSSKQQTPSPQLWLSAKHATDCTASGHPKPT